jgi:hypothetical protein
MHPFPLVVPVREKVDESRYEVEGASALLDIERLSAGSIHTDRAGDLIAAPLELKSAKRDPTEFVPSHCVSNEVFCDLA